MSQRIAAALLPLALAAGQAGLCAGWMPTPEARLACCAADAPCPMHGPAPEHHGNRAVTQAEADRCCAASEQDDSAPSPSALGLLVTPAMVLSPISALLPEPDARTGVWRASAPIPSPHVAKHLLLSVFLV